LADPFLGIDAKLNRAEEHLQVLDGYITTYLEDKPYRFVAEEHTDGHYYHFAISLEVYPFPPDEVWGPLIGDAIHNLRSALDHIAWHFSLPKARQDNPNRIEFPVFIDDPAKRPDLRGALNKKLGYLRPEFHAIVDGAQPYKTGNTHHPMWLLERLWNNDKHRTIHTSGFFFGTPSEDPQVFGYSPGHFGPFARDDPKHRAPLASGFGNTPQDVDDRVNTYKNMTVDVALGDGGSATRDAPYAGLPIRHTLRRIRAFVVERVVEPSRSLA